MQHATVREERPDRPSSALLDRPLVILMAAATGVAIANVYYNQPILGLIGADFAGTAGASLIPTATQLGYATGIVLLVPLSDQVDRRKLILRQGLGLVVALSLAALAPSIAWLVAASALVGLFATVAQQVVPFAAELAQPSTRGRMVGTVMTGLLVGILLARTLSGVVGQHFGWRAVFWMGAALAAIMIAALAARLPSSRPVSPEPYHRLLGSLWHIGRREPDLRRAAITQGLLFAGFSAFWTTLALLLREPAFGLGSDVAGLFGILALGGVAAAPFAGRFADLRGPQGGVRLGAGLVLASFLLMSIRVDLATIALGVVLMDAGIQIAMISNQAIIFALAGEARGRFNTIFIATMFTFGAGGSTAASVAWSFDGWAAVMAVAAVFSLIALVLQFSARRRRRSHKGLSR